MKTVKNLVITLLIFTLFAGSFARTCEAKQTVLIQSTESMISSSILDSAATIITMRLNDFGVGKYEISVFPEKEQIKLIFFDNIDIYLIENLITHNGVIEFWETYDRDELTDILGENNRLLAMLPASDEQERDGAVGCAAGDKMTLISNYLNTAEPDKRISFSWFDNHDRQFSCLYALKAFDAGGPIITGNDVQSALFDSDIIRIKLTDDASEKFADATRQNLDRIIVLLLDGEVVSAPRVRSEIPSGDIEISGKFTKDEAGYVAALLNNGVLPSGFNVVK